GNHGSRLHFKGRQHRAELVHGEGIVAVHQHVPAPFADSHYEHLDLEIGGGLPLREHLQDPLLDILVLHRRTLRTFKPANHVLHRFPYADLILFRKPTEALTKTTRIANADKPDFVDSTAIPAGQVLIRIDAAVAQERPVAPGAFDLAEIAFDDNRVFGFRIGLRDDLAERIGDEGVAP